MKRVALQAKQSSRASNSVCQICQYSTSRIPRQWAAPQQPSRSLPLLRKASEHAGQLRFQRAFDSSRSYATKVAKRATAGQPALQTAADFDATLQELLRETQSILNSPAVPTEEAVLSVLRRYEELVESVTLQKEPQASHENPGSPASSLLDLEESQSANAKAQNGNATSSLSDLDESPAPAKPKGDSQKLSRPVRQRLTKAVSSALNQILKDPKVFITPEILESYTKTQCRLKQADNFPEIFALYANKAIPEANSSPVKFLAPNPKSIKNAVPTELANKALDVAIEQKNLSLVLAILDSTFCAPAFMRNKIFRKAGLPLSGLAAAPVASYMLATWVASFQSAMDPKIMTGVTFAGILSYIGFTASMGVLAVTTSNDQMERVVWASGIPLRHRWLREEERAAMDKVAVAWGFKESWMRGEEEGEEWESLREFIGMRGMVLDKTDLMDGME